ncbi:CRISPR-associated protein Cas1 [Roseimicrobium gellanilyticum]|uniref:CRISPR-associated endonuclease Cas1 n=1 Tax=Roseimicrobium gellanilyticum TaxID=748857 RepID=A0A366H9B0_9BACT|nr:CRISPR-associated endonuclease Cas1 [Roseimicrobium gellanilyticum]RBP38114.1 CRISPR-associated protein Cas1 [Roseimicrobium gellanilyticum]
MLSSERLGVVAKMDLIEVTMGVSTSHGDEAVAPLSVTPVDYKAGAPRPGADANELWDTDKMQLGLQILILRDNGYTCDEGVIYYRATRQRVRLPMTPEIEEWIQERIQQARATALGSLPPPLVGSPKCVRCSLAPVCLPDETRMLATRDVQSGPEPAPLNLAESNGRDNGETVFIRRLIAARDDERALYLNTPGIRVGRKNEVLVMKDGEAVLDEVRARDVTHVALFGNIQLSTQALQMLCELEVPIAYFSMGGWFYGLTRGHGMKNVLTRIEQFRAAEDGRRCLALASRFVNGKIRNQRTLLMRLHVEAAPAVLLRLKQAALDALAARSIEALLGIEGAAAALYFQHFGGMIKVERDDDELPGLGSAEPEPEKEPEFAFDFTKRSRRPSTDPVNALLSLAYSLLAKDCTIAAHAVGFDPYVGFYHQPRFGRPALALDLMEEFRPLVAESTVLTALNNRMITPRHFVRAGDAVNLTPAGRKIFFQAYEQRMNTLITHPIFDYRVSYRRVLELQSRLLARHLTGEIPEYVPMVTR